MILLSSIHSPISMSTLSTLILNFIGTFPLASSNPNWFWLYSWAKSLKFYKFPLIGSNSSPAWSYSFRFVLLSVAEVKFDYSCITSNAECCLNIHILKLSIDGVFSNLFTFLYYISSSMINLNLFLIFYNLLFLFRPYVKIDRGLSEYHQNT